MTNELPRGYVGAAALLVAALILWPFTQALYLPLTDLPNHIARHTIMAAGPDSALATYYTSHFTLVPNSAVDLIWQAFGSPGDAITFSHRIMAIAALNLFASGMVLARVVHGHWTWFSLASGLLAFNATFLYGFQNYAFSVPFGLYAFALYYALENHPTWRRFVLFAALTPVLFLMHFFAFAVLGAMAFGREMQKLIEAHFARDVLRRGAVMAVPFLIPVAWLLYGMAAGPENPAGTHTDFGMLSERLYRLTTPLYTWATDLTAVFNLTGFAILIGLYALFATALFKVRWGLSVAGPMRGPVLVLLVVVFLAPDWLAGVALIDLRFPFVFVLVMIAASRFDVSSRSQAGVIALCLLAAIGLRSAQIAEWWRIHDAEMRDVAQLLEMGVEPGDRVVPVRAEGAFGMARHWHVQAYATAHREAFIPTLFQGVHAVQLRDAWTDHATALMHANPACALFEGARDEVMLNEPYCRVEDYIADWPEKFTHVLAMEPLSEGALNNAPVERIGSEGRFELYRVIAPAAATAPPATGS
ncbi:MAG: hypothetical protein AAGF78_07795 [Pseudomonadota bacterium]